MTDTEVIAHAMKKAHEDGWDEFKSQSSRVFKVSGVLMIEFLLGVELPALTVSCERVIFSTSFAEHFWGLDTYYFVVHFDQAPGMNNSVIGWKSEQEMIASGKEWDYYDNIPAYEYHLQQMVLEESQAARVSYLEKYL